MIQYRFVSRSIGVYILYIRNERYNTQVFHFIVYYTEKETMYFLLQSIKQLSSEYKPAISDV